MENTAGVITLIGSIVALVGWVVKIIVGYFIKDSERKTAYIETLITANQKNTIEFINTINHQRTLDREASQKMNAAVGSLKVAMEKGNQVNRQMLLLLKSKENQ